MFRLFPEVNLSVEEGSKNKGERLFVNLCPPFTLMFKLLALLL